MSRSEPDPEPRVRDVRAGELAALSALALRSKAHWGYDEAFMRACVEELSVRPEALRRCILRAVERGGGVRGFYGLSPLEDGAVELEWLFVEPDEIGSGLGRVLLEDAIAAARRAGFSALRIVADPNAEPFYARLGARTTGSEPSDSIPGRTLPVMWLDLAEPPNSTDDAAAV